MINKNEWLVVVTRKASGLSGLCHRDIPHRLFQESTRSQMLPPYHGQAVILEDDGKIVWRVTYSHGIANDGHKGVAYVSDCERYKDEWEVADDYRN